MYKVRKKDGREEDFERSKLVNSVLSAGGKQEEAEKVAAEVEAWLPTAAVNGLVDSQAIRSKVLEVLKPLSPVVADKFEAYKKQV
ncbi:MAG TPA: ATP cone domain-containing protein [Clostridia bacterium]|nr:ATP cone domain-containing protein [Clostridia bacterium]